MPDQKRVLVTGANSGLGWACSLELAKAGCFVLMACRSEKKGEDAAAVINRALGQRQAEFVHCDLSDLVSIRRCGREITARGRPLDVLINNAGTITLRREETKDGFERQLGVNHLGHYLLTHLLLPLLHSAPRARILVTTSGAHKIGKIHWDDLQLQQRFSFARAYSQSKLANVLFSYELARRLKGTVITANCFHPGAVKTNMGVESGGRAAKAIYKLFGPLFLTAAQAAAAPAAMALGPEWEGRSGLYVYRQQPLPSSQRSYDAAAGRRLWLLSAALVGLTASEKDKSHLWPRA